MSAILATKRAMSLRNLGCHVLARSFAQLCPSSFGAASPAVYVVPAVRSKEKFLHTRCNAERDTYQPASENDRLSFMPDRYTAANRTFRFKPSTSQIQVHLMADISKPAKQTARFKSSTSQTLAIYEAISVKQPADSFYSEAEGQRLTNEIHELLPRQINQMSTPMQRSSNQKEITLMQAAYAKSSWSQHSNYPGFAALLLLQHSTPANQNNAFRQPTRGISNQPVGSVVKDSECSSTKSVPHFMDNFDDVKAALRTKSSWELARAVMVLWICSFRYVADHSLKMMSVSRRLLGRRLSDFVLKKTFYGQFVAGETEAEIRESARKLSEANMGLLLAAPMEDDINSSSLNADKKFDDNLDVMLNSMVLAQELDPRFPMVQIRITGLMAGDLCALISERCPEPSTTPHVIDALAAALEGQPLDIERCFGEDFPDIMKHHLEQGIRRAAEVCKAAVSKQVMVMVDAEYTYLTPALNLFSLAMMLVCNDPKQRPPIIFYTYQNYLQTTRARLERDIRFIVDARDKGFAAKLVRGAYIYRERLLAAEKGRPDPIQPTYDATSAAFDAAVTAMLSEIAARPGRFRTIVASHNEASILSTVKGMQKQSIDPQGGSVFFGQLLGMADHISYNLGINGFLVRKSMPYGPVAETLPYLSRRAQENHSLLVGAGPRRERAMLKAELGDRFKLRT